MGGKINTFINIWLSDGVFPNKLKVVKIIPLLQTGSCLKVNNNSLVTVSRIYFVLAK